uniref:Uncharacterized protein n=2 Tax=Caenorhabditis japonica TaxID=281687 RepID=A0A8R1EXD8_CAEJA
MYASNYRQHIHTIIMSSTKRPEPAQYAAKPRIVDTSVASFFNKLSRAEAEKLVVRIQGLDQWEAPKSPMSRGSVLAYVLKGTLSSPVQHFEEMTARLPFLDDSKIRSAFFHTRRGSPKDAQTSVTGLAAHSAPQLNYRQDSDIDLWLLTCQRSARTAVRDSYITDSAEQRELAPTATNSVANKSSKYAVSFPAPESWNSIGRNTNVSKIIHNTRAKKASWDFHRTKTTGKEGDSQRSRLTPRSATKDYSQSNSALRTNWRHWDFGEENDQFMEIVKEWTEPRPVDNLMVNRHGQTLSRPADYDEQLPSLKAHYESKTTTYGQAYEGLKGNIKNHFGTGSWVFQQYGAPAHRAKATEQWFKGNFPEFLTAAG